MPLTAYCKKCARDVEMGETCPHCGGKLPRNAARVAWCVDHDPVRDWMCWNAAMRIILPISALVLALILLTEGLAGGVSGIQRLLEGGLLLTLLGLLLLVLVLLLLTLMLQGEDVLDCVVDNKGLHIQQYLPQPTPLKLLLRLKSPALLQQYDPQEGILLISQKELAWKDVARVQLWPEKTIILFYAPAWWMRLALPCTPFTYMDCMDYIREKLGRKKSVLLPRELVAPPKPKQPKASKQEQLTMDLAVELPQTASQPVTEEEQPQDFVSLEDVLAEIKQAEEADSQPAPEENDPEGVL